MPSILCHVSQTDWCRRYLPRYLFSVSNSVCFSSIYRSPGRTSTAAYNWFWYAISDVAENLDRYLSCAERISQRKELILTVKMETRHPVDGQFGPVSSEFPEICNHCGFMAAWSRKTRKFCHPFLNFYKRHIIAKFSKFCSERLHCDTDWDCCVEIW